MDVDNRGTDRRVLAELASMPQVQQVVRDRAIAIRDDAKRIAPRDTGRLARRGIGIEKDRDPDTGYIRWLVGWTPIGWYGWLVETGTEDTTPQPHLVPAAIKHGAVSGGGD